VTHSLTVSRDLVTCQYSLVITVQWLTSTV